MGQKIKAGEPFSFRFPVNTPPDLIDYLNQLKETEKRNFGSKLIELIERGIHCEGYREDVIPIKENTPSLKPVPEGIEQMETVTEKEFEEPSHLDFDNFF
ncbi:MAG: hypothetical protein ACH0QD_13185 [Tepidibacillus sp.]